MLGSILFTVASPAYSDITELQKLRFGEFIVTNNSTQQGITVNVDGSFGFSSIFLNIEDPQPGIYEIDGLTPNSMITVTASQIQPLTGAGNFFTLRSFQTLDTDTNGAGVTTITLGATAETSGNSTPYVDQTYNGIIEIQISF